MRTYSITLLMLLIFLAAGCNIYEQDGYEELVVVEAYAIAGRSLPDVKVSRTVPANEEYQFAEAAIDDAIVKISYSGQGGSVIEGFEYEQISAGLYRATNRSHLVEAGATYLIEIEFNGRTDQIRGQTTVPEQFQILNTIADSYVYQSDDQLELLLSATESSARQNIYVFNTITLQPSVENLTPFYFDAVENGDSSLEEFISNTSGLINEGNFEINDDQTILLRFPWIGVAFFGENLVVTNSVDQNMADLLRSEELQLGGSTLPPGEIPNLIYSIEGGIGVFGSFSTDTVFTNFIRPVTTSDIRH